MKIRIDIWFLIGIFSIILLAYVLLFPLGYLLRDTFVDLKTGKFTLLYLTKFFKTKYYWVSLFNSLFVSIVTTGLAMILGILLAFITARTDIPGKSTIRSLSTMMLMTPPFMGAFAWLLLLGRYGLITTFLKNSLGIRLPSIMGWPGIVLADLFPCSVYVYLVIEGGLSQIDASLEEAAQTLGASKLYAFLTVILPTLFPSLMTGVIMSFLAVFSDFGTPMVLGGDFRVLPTLAYMEFFSELGRTEMASTLCVIMILVALLLFITQKVYVQRKSYTTLLTRRLSIIKLSKIGKIIALIYCVIIISLGLLPTLTVAAISFAKIPKGSRIIRFDQFTFKNWHVILFESPEPIINSLFYSSVAIAFNILLGVLISYIVVRKKGSILAYLLDSLVMIPYIVAGTVIGIGLIKLFNKPPLILTGTWIILVISYFVRKLPFTVRQSSAILYQIDRAIEEASIILGASPLKTFFNLTVKLMAPGIIAGAMMSFIMIITELSSTIVLYTARTKTMTTAIYEDVMFINYGPAAALSTLLMILTYIPILFVTKFYQSQGKEKSGVIKEVEGSTY